MNPLWHSIGKIKKTQKKYKIPLALGVLLVFSLFVTILASFPLTKAKAVFTNDGNFKIALTISQQHYYVDENIEIGMTLANNSAQNQYIRFGGACQATYKIYDIHDNLVFPRFADETPCNNWDLEEFLMSPGQVKRYYFKILAPKQSESPVISAGSYKIVGIIDGFGTTEPMPFEVSNRPDYSATEGELCEGLTGRTCGKGLECKYRGGFTDGAGMCTSTSNTFEPKNTCENGLGNCFKDVRNDHPAKDVIEKFIIYGRVSGYPDGSFHPDEFIKVGDFEKLVSKISGNSLQIQTNDAFVQRDTAVKALYINFISDKEPRNLAPSKFDDISNSPNANYIISAEKLGIINGVSANKFAPTRYLTRAEALILIDKFEQHNKKVTK